MPARRSTNGVLHHLAPTMQAKQDATELQEKSKEMKVKIKEAEELEKQVGAARGCGV